MKHLLLACLMLLRTGCGAIRELARQDREWQEQHRNDPPPKTPRCYYSMSTGQYELYPSGMDSMPLIEWENYGRRVWHAGCGRGSPMARRTETLKIEDGSFLWLYECSVCGARVYAGADSQRRIVRRPAESKGSQ